MWWLKVFAFSIPSCLHTIRLPAMAGIKSPTVINEELIQTISDQVVHRLRTRLEKLDWEHLAVHEMIKGLTHRLEKAEQTIQATGLEPGADPFQKHLEKQNIARQKFEKTFRGEILGMVNQAEYDIKMLNNLEIMTAMTKVDEEVAGVKDMKDKIENKLERDMKKYREERDKKDKMYDKLERDKTENKLERDKKELKAAEKRDAERRDDMNENRHQRNENMRRMMNENMDRMMDKMKDNTDKRIRMDEHFEIKYDLICVEIKAQIISMTEQHDRLQADIWIQNCTMRTELQEALKGMVSLMTQGS